MQNVNRFITLSFLLIFCEVSHLHAVATADEFIPEYEKTANLKGSLSSTGSDTLKNLMMLWRDGFRSIYPNVTINIQAAGSSTAPPALISHKANIAPMSRQMKRHELEAFEKKFGYQPTVIPVAIDALAVFVHKNNPIIGLSLTQVDAIFSSTRTCGASLDISKWEQLGISKNGLGNSDIKLYGRNTVSGTYSYFKKKALCKGDYKKTVQDQSSSALVVHAVSKTPDAIGYSGIGYKTPDVKVVALSKEDGEAFVSATSETAVDGSYPLSRLLYVYINKPPETDISQIEYEFLKFILSNTGQSIVVDSGFIPLPSKLITKARNQLGIH